MISPTPASPAWPAISRRLASMLYEALLVVGVLVVAFLIPQILFSTVFKLGMAGPLLLLHVLLVMAVYFVWFWRHGGQTLAMKTWKIRLVAVGRSRIGVGQALLRFLLAWPSILLGGAGLLWALFDKDRQFLHDRLAGTQLIRC